MNVVASVPIAMGQSAVDRCAGPVEVTYPGATPQIVQHDYCGGTWVLGLRRGEVIRFRGATVGTYVVNGRSRVIADGTPVTGVNGLGDLVAQTCIPGTQSIRIVGLSRVGP